MEGQSTAGARRAWRFMAVDMLHGTPHAFARCTAGEMLVVAEPFLMQSMHPTVIVRAYRQALDAAMEICESIAVDIDTTDEEQMRRLILSCIGTKFTSRFGDLMADLALKAVQRVMVEQGGHKIIDTKRYAKVEKIPGGDLSECRVLDGVMINKDVTHARMRRRIENPRILLLDCPVEYKKGESQTSLEITKEEDFAAILRQEEEYVERMCADIIRLKPDLVCTEKGVSDLAQHYLYKAGISVLRRLRKTDNNRIARCCGATIVHRTEELTEEDIGTGCGLFEVRKFGDEYFSFIEECADPKACTILLRGASKDVLMEIERNLEDAIGVARNVMFEPKLLPGGGATEMAIAQGLAERSTSVAGVEAWPFRAVGRAMEVIPRTLAQNCGADVVRLLTELRAAKAEGANPMLGLDGSTGKLADVSELGIWDPFTVKTQTIKTAIEAACMLLRIDDIVSGMTSRHKKADAAAGARGGAPSMQPMPGM